MFIMSRTRLTSAHRRGRLSPEAAEGADDLVHRIRERDASFAGVAAVAASVVLALEIRNTGALHGASRQSGCRPQRHRSSTRRPEAHRLEALDGFRAGRAATIQTGSPRSEFTLSSS